MSLLKKRDGIMGNKHVKLGEGDPTKGKWISICSLHQQMLQIIKTLPDDGTRRILIDLLSQAFDCGVKMDKKLSEYKKAKEWKPETYKKR